LGIVFYRIREVDREGVRGKVECKRNNDKNIRETSGFVKEDCKQAGKTTEKFEKGRKNVKERIKEWK
jgi:hypothetical protein